MNSMTKTTSRRKPSAKTRPGPKSRIDHGASLPSRSSSKARFDRYVTLAREAAALGNRIDAENYYQHAEHYFRLMNPSSEAG